MVKSYVVAFYGEEFLRTYALFERSLPLFAIGGRVSRVARRAAGILRRGRYRQRARARRRRAGAHLDR
jgi:hypothetical protein